MSSTPLPSSARARFWFIALGVLITLLLPLLFIGIVHRLWVRRRALAQIRGKITGLGPALPHGGILIHGVSLGETALMKPLLAQLPAETTVVLTSSTETGLAGLAAMFPDRPQAAWPLDLPWAVHAFLRRTKPRMIILLEAELWPLALLAARARGIPVVMLNARASERSHRRWRMLRGMARRLIGSLSLAVVQEPIYAARLADLGIPRQRLALSGSLKADMVRPATVAAAEAEAQRIALTDGPLLLLASTSDPEEAPLLASWKNWGATSGWHCVVVPRHPERGEAIATHARALGLTARCTNSPSPQPPASSLQPAAIIIVNEIGRLGALYALCAARGGIAVVGGSLGSGRGGQNMLEAAAAGCCTVVGWDTLAQPDPMRLLRTAGAVVELTPAQVDATLAALAVDPARRAVLGTTAQQAWALGRGALARTMRILKRSGLPLLATQTPQDSRP